MAGISRLLVLLCLMQQACALITNESLAWDYLESYSAAASLASNTQSKVHWDYATNITDHNQQRILHITKEYKPFYEEVSANASLFDYANFKDAILKRTFQDLANKGWAALSNEKYDEVNELSTSLETIYGEAKICKPGSSKKYALEPELTELLASSRNAEELLWIWKNWRDVTGKKMRTKYQRFMELQNEAAKANGYSDAGEYWRRGYLAPGLDFRANLETIYTELEPFYKQLHKYVRHKLKAKYGADKFPSSGHIPAHLLGNMWAQTWGNIEDLTLPFDSVQRVNATPAIQQLTVRQIFEKANEFFTSLGLENVTPEFWARSMLEKPEDGRNVQCHASAWDFNDGKDFRIKQCTRKNMEDFITVHHELGHIQYYLQYKDLLYPFRTGANPGFHEAVGDVLALSVSTPTHLKTVGLIDDFDTNADADINYLMSIALDKIVFLPFAKLMDDYRWALFAGEISPNNLNSAWWSRRCKYQGISPPVQRSEEDFDAGAKYHIPANVPYIRYFVSYIIQFQFHKALCQAAGHSGPLHTCDIYRSKEAGKKLGDMLKLGASYDWQTALEAVTGSRVMSAQPMIDYFQPLTSWLTDYNKNIPDEADWIETCPTDLPEASTAMSGECSEIKPPGNRASTADHVMLVPLIAFLLEDTTPNYSEQAREVEETFQQ